MPSPRLVQQQMLTLIEQALENGEAMPSDQEFADQLKLLDGRQARAVLADLADAGKITVGWNAPGRPITLGRKRSTFAPAKPVAPSIVRRNEDGERVRVRPDTVLAVPHKLLSDEPTPRSAAEDAAVDKIKRILRPDPAPAPAAEEAATEPVADTPPPMPPARPDGAITRLPTAPGRALSPSREQRRQLNAWLDQATFAAVEKLAAEAGVLPGAWARQVIVDLVERRDQPAAEPLPAFARGAKPFIRAEVIRAAARDDMPLHDFVTMLIERGFASYEADAALERAA